jgi:hypothetical protein
MRRCSSKGSKAASNTFGVFHGFSQAGSQMYLVHMDVDGKLLGEILREGELRKEGRVLPSRVRLREGPKCKKYTGPAYHH